jgi:ribosomal protein L20
MQTERVTYLTSADQKAALEAFARARGESVGNVVREATARYMAKPEPAPSADEEEALRLLVAELNAAVPAMRASLDRSIARIKRSNIEIDRKLAEMDARR